jgi:hypothetical protein
MYKHLMQEQDKISFEIGDWFPQVIITNGSCQYGNGYKYTAISFVNFVNFANGF